jgi:hypothetical protein
MNLMSKVLTSQIENRKHWKCIKNCWKKSNANYNEEQSLCSPQKPNENGWITTIALAQFLEKTKNNLPNIYVNKKQWNTSDEKI